MKKIADERAGLLAHVDTELLAIVGELATTAEDEIGIDRRIVKRAIRRLARARLALEAVR